MANQGNGVVSFLLDSEMLSEDIGTHKFGRTILKIHVSLSLGFVKKSHVDTMRPPNVPQGRAFPGTYDAYRGLVIFLEAQTHFPPEKSLPEFQAG